MRSDGKKKRQETKNYSEEELKELGIFIKKKNTKDTEDIIH